MKYEIRKVKTDDQYTLETDKVIYLKVPVTWLKLEKDNTVTITVGCDFSIWMPEESNYVDIVERKT